MPYNNLISRTNSQALIPEVVRTTSWAGCQPVGGVLAVPSGPDGGEPDPDAGPVGAADRVLRQRRHRSEADH
jgi:hypothetical protein